MKVRDPPQHRYRGRDSIREPSNVNPFQKSLKVLPLGACFILAFAALWRLGNELPKLAFEQGTWAAFDLRVYHEASRAWFTEPAFYGSHALWDYPPASYLLFWVMAGWMDLEVARLTWAITTFLALMGFAWIFQSQSPVSTPSSRTLMGIFPFACYFPSAAIYVGQPSMHVVFAIALCGFLILPRQRTPARDGIAALALMFTLLKPTMGFPFLMLVSLLPGRFHIALLASGSYLALSLLAAAFRNESLWTLSVQWLSLAQSWKDYGEGHANLSRILTLTGLDGIRLPALALALGLLAVWAWRHRHGDIWLQLAVTGLVARLFIHHRLHDDGLVIFAMLPLLQLLRVRREQGRTVTATLLLLLMNAAALLLPAQFFHQEIWQRWLLESIQGTIWLGTLIFLLIQGPGIPTRT